ncbi:sugar-phosphatase [Rosenbergiella australiborealis]|uniref:Sugar-phosphatase n=1 Tax=Rosenbergiella australiborealis TaxID=1544696 RepID=A0ABS5T4U0_9GAMM|nr:sugar-phosphatase [Rosenbergiella australiborealis]MBT0727379.1 sugar-phosphatase [Rosenbergiella australiborealis]
MTVKMIALDMDGTLLNPQHEITAAVKSAIEDAKAQGILVVLASGRPYIGMEKFIAELGLNTPGQYCISYNGGLVQRAEDGQPILETTLGMDDYHFFEQLAQRLGVHFQALDKQYLYTPNKDISRYTVHESEITGIPLRYRGVDEMQANARFPKLMIVDEPELLDNAISQLPPELFDRYTLVKSASHYLEILDKRVSKGNSVRHLAEQLGISAQEVLAVGDHENDLTMLAWAGYGVAMGNAIDAVKEQASYHTASNQEDGVAKAIRQWALQ